MYPHAPAIDLASPYNFQSVLIKTTRLTLASTCSVIMIRLPTVNLTTGSHTQETLKKSLFPVQRMAEIVASRAAAKKNCFSGFFLLRKLFCLQK